jgi:hypothetical protein
VNSSALFPSLSFRLLSSVSQCCLSLPPLRGGRRNSGLERHRSSASAEEARKVGESDENQERSKWNDAVSLSVLAPSLRLLLCPHTVKTVGSSEKEEGEEMRTTVRRVASSFSLDSDCWRRPDETTWIANQLLHHSQHSRSSKKRLSIPSSSFISWRRILSSNGVGQVAVRLWFSLSSLGTH